MTNDKRFRVVLVIVVVVLLVSIVSTLAWQSYVHKSSVAYEPNQILFVGPSFYATNATRNYDIIGNLEINLTEPGPVQFTLSDEKYYAPGATGNGSTFSTVNAITQGNISINGGVYSFIPAKECVQTVTGGETTEGNTVIATASCNESALSTTFTTAPIRSISSSGLYGVGYSLYVPANASAGTYLIDITITSQSLVNMATMSGIATFVVTVIVPTN